MSEAALPAVHGEHSTARALSEHSPASLACLLQSWGMKPSHATPLLRSFYQGNGVAFPETSHRFPHGLKERIAADLPLRSTRQQIRRQSLDGTTKLLLRLQDGLHVESVMMPDYRDDRAAGCVSSQVGCAMGCDFCATAQSGFARNLTAGEIVEQFLELRAEAQSRGRRLHTLVFMGMGEPLLNLDAVLEAVRRIGDNALGGLGWRQITVSTVGIIPGIEALANSGLNVQLAVSLHAPDDDTRSRILPMGKRYGVEAVLAAAEAYQAKTGRTVIIQYCLLRDINDSTDQARLLAERIVHRRMHVNLLPYNATGPSLKGRTYAAPSPGQAAAFLAELRRHGVVAHARRARGSEIEAACGQLRREAKGHELPAAAPSDVANVTTRGAQAELGTALGI